METAQQFDTKITSAKTILLDIEGTTTSKSFVKVGHKSHVSSKYTNPLFTFIQNRVNWMICVIVCNDLDEEWVNFGKKIVLFVSAFLMVDTWKCRTSVFLQTSFGLNCCSLKLLAIGLYQGLMKIFVFIYEFNSFNWKLS